jgi:DNA primase catalytic core
MTSFLMPKLDPRTVDEVRSKADLYDVVSERVVLRKAGKDYKGLCPFHEDRSPSFYVSPSKQIYKCFSCGASGDVFKFLMEQVFFHRNCSGSSRSLWHQCADSPARTEC